MTNYFWLICITFLLNLKVFTESELILCSKNVSRIHVCKKQANHRPNVTPYPRLCVIKPVVDIKDILNINVEKKTITVYLYIILQWIDDSLSYAIPEGEE